MLRAIKEQCVLKTYQSIEEKYLECCDWKTKLERYLVHEYTIYIFAHNKELSSWLGPDLTEDLGCVHTFK